MNKKKVNWLKKLDTRHKEFENYLKDSSDELYSLYESITDPVIRFIIFMDMDINYSQGNEFVNVGVGFIKFIETSKMYLNRAKLELPNIDPTADEGRKELNRVAQYNSILQTLSSITAMINNISIFSGTKYNEAVFKKLVEHKTLSEKYVNMSMTVFKNNMNSDLPEFNQVHGYLKTVLGYLMSEYQIDIKIVKQVCIDFLNDYNEEFKNISDKVENNTSVSDHMYVAGCRIIVDLIDNLTAIVFTKKDKQSEV